MNSQQWEIKPGKGLGYLEFGIGQLEAKAFDHLYGESAHTNIYGNDAAKFDEYLSPFAGFFSEEMLKLGLEDAKSKDIETQGLIEEIRNPNCYLRLDFWHGHLSALTVDQTCRALNFRELYLFDMEPRDALRALYEMNGGALVKDFNVVFDKLGIVMVDFHYQSSSGAWRYIPYGDADVENRFVMIFDTSQKERYFGSDFENVNFRLR